MRGSVPRVNRRAKVTLGVVGAIVVLLVILSQFVGLWAEWVWYEEIDYSAVFSGMLWTKVWLFVLFGLGVGAFVGANLYLAFRLRPFMRTNSPEQQALERYRALLGPRIGLWFGLFAGVVGLFAGLSGQGHWQQWMLFRNRQDFGIVDPQFGIDVGFYVFDYPFWRYLLDVGFTAVALAVMGALVVHYLFGGVRLQGAAYFLDRRALLLELNSATDTWGAGYTDINAVLPAKEILAYISIVVAIAVLVFSNVGGRNLVWAGASLALLGVSAVAIGGIYPFAVQQISAGPNVKTLEAQYIQRSIDFTRKAYGIDTITRTAYSQQNVTPPASLVNDTTIVPTIRLLDPALVNDTFTQYQQVRKYYDFAEKLDVDRYTINGTVQDYVVGVRELNYAKLDDPNWQNRHTVYTHGYGFVAAPANRTCDGGPYFVSGLVVAEQPDAETPQTNSCRASGDAIPVEQPRIYYGEVVGSPVNDYVIVGKAGDGPDVEFDRPTGTSQENYTYTGKGGVPMASTFRKIMFGLYFREPNFLLFQGFNENSKVMYIRNPRERVEKAAPFLTLDGDPYPAVVNGRVTWILDGYTTSSTYPYSEQVDLRTATQDANSDRGTVLQARQNINYIRNSVKATVDAYDGTVTLYAYDENDPVLKAWNQAFGGNLIKPRSAISEDLAAHFRYPEDLFKVQRDLLSKFHVGDPLQFNEGNAFWAVPADPASGAGTKQPPYYLLTKFPGEETSQFQLVAALTPERRDNLAALLSGVLTPEGPKLTLLELPSDGRIAGPGQAKQQMVTDQGVSDALLPLSNNNSKVSYGNLLSLPFAGGLLYVQPVYVTNSGSSASFPLMREVLVSYGSTVGYGKTLGEALQKLVANSNQQPSDDGGGGGGGGTVNPPPTTGGSVDADLLAAADRLDQAIRKVQAAQASGDFKAYGEALAELQAAMQAFQEAQARAKAATPAATG
jgi:uncharacterized membrane protein (UPF0182 family)